MSFAPTAVGVIALVGWMKTLLVLTYCVWVMMVAWGAVKLRRPSNRDQQLPNITRDRQ